MLRYDRMDLAARVQSSTHDMLPARSLCSVRLRKASGSSSVPWMCKSSSEARCLPFAAMHAVEMEMVCSQAGEAQAAGSESRDLWQETQLIERTGVGIHFDSSH